MDFDDILENLTPLMHSSLGQEEIILTRACGLTAAKSSSTPSQLAIAVDAGAGAATVMLQLVGGGAVRGRLQDGCRLTIGGGVYVVSAEVTLPIAPASSEAIGPVSITPHLTAGAAAGDLVALAGPEYSWKDGLVIRVGRTGNYTTDIQELMHLEVSLPHITAPTVPRKGDGFYRPKDGTRGSISKIPVVFGGAWDIEVGSD